MRNKQWSVTILIIQTKKKISEKKSVGFEGTFNHKNQKVK